MRPLRNLWVHAVALSMHSTRSQLRLYTWCLRRLHMGMFLARRCLSLPRWWLGGTSSAICFVWALWRWAQGWRQLVGVYVVVCWLLGVHVGKFWVPPSPLMQGLAAHTRVCMACLRAVCWSSWCRVLLWELQWLHPSKPCRSPRWWVPRQKRPPRPGHRRCQKRNRGRWQRGRPLMCRPLWGGYVPPIRFCAPRLWIQPCASSCWLNWFLSATGRVEQ